MNEPRATVIMAVKGEEPAWIRAAVESIRMQTWGDFRALVICDGEPSQVVKDYLLHVSSCDARIKVRVVVPQGLTKILIAGIADVTTEFIIRHDADDWSDVSRFARQIAWLDAHPDHGAVGTNFYATDQNGRILYRSRWPTTHREINAHLESGSPLCHGSVIMRRSAYLQAGGYRSEFSCAQDYDLFWRMADLAPIANLLEPLYFFRRRAGSISTTKTLEQVKFGEAARLLARRRKARLPEDVAAAISEATHKLDDPKICGRALLRSGDYLLLAGSTRGALKRYMQSWRRNPADAFVYGKLLRLILWSVTPSLWKGMLIRQ